MNSCTLTFKQIQKRLFYVFLLIIFSIVVLDGVIYYIIDSRTTKYSFVEEKQSKIKHFNLNKVDNRDIIFIGDSRTIFHISSQIFKDEGLDIYNFGVSGNSLVNYQGYVVDAINQKPKMIVLNLGLEELYKPLGKVLNPSLSDVMFYKTIGEDKLFLESIYQWFLSYHTLFNYSEVLVFKAKILYEGFNPLKKKTIRTNFITSLTKSKVEYDCIPFVTQKINEQKTIIRCKNGDGILLGNIDDKSLLQEVKKLKKINLLSLSFLKSIVKLIESKNIEVLVLFEPMLSSHYIIEDNFSNYLKNISFLNISEYYLNRKFIVDAGHFNIYGRDVYSKYLVEILKKELDE